MEQLPGQVTIEEWLNDLKDDSWWHKHVCGFCNSMCSEYGGYPTYEPCAYLRFKMGKGHLCDACFDECRGKCTANDSTYYGQLIKDIPLDPKCQHYDACYGGSRDMEERAKTNEQKRISE